MQLRNPGRESAPFLEDTQGIRCETGPTRRKLMLSHRGGGFAGLQTGGIGRHDGPAEVCLCVVRHGAHFVVGVLLLMLDAGAQVLDMRPWIGRARFGCGSCWRRRSGLAGFGCGGAVGSGTGLQGLGGGTKRLALTPSKAT